MNALKYHWCLLFQIVLKHVLSKGFIFKKSVQGTGSKNKEIYGFVPHQKFFMSCYITFKKKLQHVGHKWVICGSHPDCSMGQWVKWVNRCDPLSTLIQVAYVEMITDAKMFEIVIITLSLHLWELLIVLRLASYCVS